MAELLLVISTIQHEFTHLRVKCATRRNTGDLKTLEREFCEPCELESALIAAGVECDEAHAAFLVFETGLPTFIPVSLNTAWKLGVLE
jgi:hypothetical protein